MANTNGGRVHLEVWDILCPECSNLFWKEPRNMERFFVGLCEKCAEAFIEWATRQGETGALKDYQMYRGG